MSPAAGQPSGRIVAELGRPETPAEAAARQAESSRRYRSSKTFPNLVGALLVCLGVVLAVVLLVPRDDAPVVRDVDVAQIAEGAQAVASEPLAVPAVPDGWKANSAELRQGRDGVTEWYAGYVIPDGAGEASEYAGFSQGIGANPTWVLERTGERTPTGTAELDGRVWDVYDYTSLSAEQAGNSRYALATVWGGSTIVVYGSGSSEHVTALARAISASLPGE